MRTHTHGGEGEGLSGCLGAQCILYTKRSPRNNFGEFSDIQNPNQHTRRDWKLPGLEHLLDGVDLRTIAILELLAGALIHLQIKAKPSGQRRTKTTCTWHWVTYSIDGSED